MTDLKGAGLRVERAGRAILDGVDLAVGGGELVGLIGPNGAGKSTLLRCLAGLVAPEAGAVVLDGVPIRGMPASARAKRLAYLAQGAEIHWPLTVDRLVALGRLPHLGAWASPDDTDTRAIADAMDLCDVTSLRWRTATSLSGGERARVLLARALAANPAILLADEPVSGLDPHHQLRVMGVLRKLSAKGMGIVVVLHDLTLAARFCDRIILLHDGRSAAEGPPSDVLRIPLLQAIYGVTMMRTEIDGSEIFVPWRCTEGET